MKATTNKSAYKHEWRPYNQLYFPEKDSYDRMYINITVREKE